MCIVDFALLKPTIQSIYLLQLKLQQRRTREELVNQGIMPPLKSSASFHEQRRSLERARTEDYLKRKIRSRPERSELVRMHILEETSAEPSLQARQLLLKRARLADDLNDKISQRPGLMELIHKNILPVHSSLKQAIIETEFPKVEAESSSFDEESSDAFSPEQTLNQDYENKAKYKYRKLKAHNIAYTYLGSERPVQRSKKVRDNKPKVKKLKYHQYVPPDQKPEREPPPLLDSSYTKLLYQQQLFLQLQIINQQQQNYNYHTILPAPPKPPADQQPASANCPSPSNNDTPPQSTSTNLTGQNQQTAAIGGGIKIGPLPPNLDELKVAELKQELKVRGLTVSGTKNDLIERLKNFHEQNGGTNAPTTSKTNTPPAPVVGGVSSSTQSADRNVGVASFSFIATAERGGAQMTAPQIMQFGSTSSSPPVSPAHSEHSSTGMSPDETSCNGDAFGEMVTSPLTQLSLQPSPPLPSTICIKEEPGSWTSPSSCCLVSQSAAPAIDKDQMLQEKDRRIQELTRMLLQKQQLVESLRSQLKGKRVDAPDRSTEELPGVTMEQIRAIVKEEVIEVIEDTAHALCFLHPTDISENFKAAPDPVLERLRPNTPLCSSSSPLSLSRPPDTPLKTFILEPQPPSIKMHSNCDPRGGRLEDFLESTTGKPLLGVEPGGPTTLIVDLHNQMLSTPSILDHPRSPMDTCDMGFSSHSPSDLIDSASDPMDWLELGMGGTGGEGPGMVHMNGHSSSSLFSTDFLDTSDMNWSSL
uniref:Myocardin related transcription factor Aa n=1 Tax=Cyprinus carpio TaxID=7962 RepID=A0A8C2IBD3_CYPCA